MGKNGFTLLEIMVVLVIIGITLGFVTVNLSRSDAERLGQEGGELAAVLENVHDKAMDDGLTTGWTFEQGRFRLWRYDAQRQWQPLQGTDGTGLHLSPDTQLVSLTINEQPAALTDKLVFSPEGINLPYALTLVLGNARLVLHGDAAGHVRVGSS